MAARILRVRLAAAEESDLVLAVMVQVASLLEAALLVLELVALAPALAVPALVALAPVLVAMAQVVRVWAATPARAQRRGVAVGGARRRFPSRL